MSFSLIIGEDMKIAIDGPAGSGKSTIAKLLSKKLNYEYIDTGALYRAITYILNNKNLNIEDEEMITSTIKKSDFRFYKNKLFLNGVCIEKEIRENSISQRVSEVAAIPYIRDILVVSENIILDGRDIGTVVLPEAELKIYLDASPNIRAKRRYLELIEKNESIDLDELENEIVKRDFLDSNREVAPLKKADDAITIITDDLNIQQVVDKIYNLLNKDL
jgi:cytidylate kinase